MQRVPPNPEAQSESEKQGQQRVPPGPTSSVSPATWTSLVSASSGTATSVGRSDFRQPGRKSVAPSAALAKIRRLGFTCRRIPERLVQIKKLFEI